MFETFVAVAFGAILGLMLAWLTKFGRGWVSIGQDQHHPPVGDMAALLAAASLGESAAGQVRLLGERSESAHASIDWLLIEEIPRRGLIVTCLLRPKGGRRVPLAFRPLGHVTTDSGTFPILLGMSIGRHDKLLLEVRAVLPKPEDSLVLVITSFDSPVDVASSRTDPPIVGPWSVKLAPAS